MSAPIIHERPDGFFVILDQRNTPFWWAVFVSEEHALLAWESYKFQLRLEAVHAASTVRP